MPRVSNANPAPRTFHDRAVKVAEADGRRLQRTCGFAGDCFVAPLIVGSRINILAGIAIAPLSTVVGVATCVVAVPPLMAKIGADALAVKLSE